MATKKERVENEVAFCGGHHDGKTMVIDPKQDKIELDWVELKDQRETANLVATLVNVIYKAVDKTNPGVDTTAFVNGGTKTGRDTYYRNPDEGGQFLFDDGRDYRLARYKADEAIGAMKAESLLRISNLEKRLVKAELDNAALKEIVGPGVVCADITRAIVELDTWLAQCSHSHAAKGKKHIALLARRQQKKDCGFMSTRYGCDLGKLVSVTMDGKKVNLN